MKKIMIAHRSEAMIALLANRFSNSEELYFFRNGTDVLEAITEINPDLLVIDLFLPEIDGLSVIRRIKGKATPRLLVTSTSLSTFAYNAAINYGADLFITTPCNPDDLYDHIMQLLNYNENTQRVFNAESYVSELLQKLGFNPAAAGSRYLRAGIPIYAKDQNLQFCKEVIPAIVESCHCRSADQVEHGIREAIRFAWHKGDPAMWQAYFSSSCLTATKCPTNKAFIARLALELLKEEATQCLPSSANIN